jgi:hypothetical protein
MPRALTLLLPPLLSALLLSGCYHMRVTTNNADPVTEGSETVHVLAWGLVQPAPVTASPCASNNLDEVRVHSNLAFALATVVTLGFYMPLTLEWRCAEVQDSVRDFE